MTPSIFFLKKKIIFSQINKSKFHHRVRTHRAKMRGLHIHFKSKNNIISNPYLLELIIMEKFEPKEQ